HHLCAPAVPMSGTKRKAADEVHHSSASEMDWRAQPRRPFKRVFVPYNPEAVDMAGGAAAVAARRKALGVDLIDDPAGEDATAPPFESFEELGVLPPWLLQALRDDGFTEPSPMQAQALPVALSGQNTIVVGADAERATQAGVYLLPAILQAIDQPLLSEQ
ncbi:unnamed protein product, partial [Polarella glacialis]